MITPLMIIILAIIQGLAELLPVSSSAHVIVAEKLMKIDPSSPAATLLLVMLHTGTMFAVIVYFWKAWEKAFFSSKEKFKQSAILVCVATAVTGIVGLGLQKLIVKVMEHLNKEKGKAEIEDLFKHLDIIAVALFAAGVLILLTGLKKKSEVNREEVTLNDALAIGATQGLCLPFRGFSRSGATISVGIMRNLAKMRSEEYSFALAVVLTPVVIAREVLRLRADAKLHGTSIHFEHFTPSLIGMVASFFAGLVALKILSKLLEHGRWWIFGIYCIVASIIVLGLHINHL